VASDSADSSQDVKLPATDIVRTCPSIFLAVLFESDV
jgi:hypothetical protein